MMKLYKIIIVAALSMLSTLSLSAQGWPENYGGVMLQGFYWDSFTDSRWLELESQADELAASFDLIWIPQSGNCGGTSMGYDDLWWFNDYNSSFGSEAELRSMLQTFKKAGLGTIADVVINHRKNLSNWVDFPKETYKGVTYQMVSTDICRDDDGGETLSWAQKNGYSLSSNNDTGEGWGGMRDLDHKSTNVQNIVQAYLDFLLNDLGYTGFRYDMVKGYSASFTGQYNAKAGVNYSVGEYWDGVPSAVKSWIDGTKVNGKVQSAAFDFPFRYTVRDAINGNSWKKLSNASLMSDAAYRRYAVTFVENHDTEKRSNAEQDPIRKDTLAANAFMLAMPGTPCVFFKHWQAYKPEIKAMIEARRLAGINNMSTYLPFRTADAYFANTVKVNNVDKLLVVVGNEASVKPGTAWVKALSGYHYAYYLNKNIESAWVDKASCEFTEAFDVTLSALSNATDAKLVYTTDGTMPTASNGKQVESGATISISETTKLNVGLLVSGTVKGVISRTYTFKEAEVFVVPPFCVVNGDELCAFFEAPSSWSTIKCWCWADGVNFTGGTWPGQVCDYVGTADNGNKVYKWTYRSPLSSVTTLPTGIIFNNNNSSQTEDLDFVNGGYYNFKGYLGTVTTGIVTVRQDDSAAEERIYDLQGRRVTGPLHRGIYIINGKKVVK